MIQSHRSDGPQVWAAGDSSARLHTHVGYLIASYTLGSTVDRSWVTKPPLWPGLLLLVLALWPRRAPMLLRAGLVVAGVALLARPGTRHHAYQTVLWPGLLDTANQIEALAADTEAEAVRLGRWPTVAEWHARHGTPASPSGEPIEYVLAPGSADWAATLVDPPAYTIRVRAPWVRMHDPQPADSRLFGPDGLFGTADDDELLRTAQPSLYGRASWPHGRTPRDRRVKLPPRPQGHAQP